MPLDNSLQRLKLRGKKLTIITECTLAQKSWKLINLSQSVLRKCLIGKKWKQNRIVSQSTSNSFYHITHNRKDKKKITLRWVNKTLWTNWIKKLRRINLYLAIIWVNYWKIHTRSVKCRISTMKMKWILIYQIRLMIMYKIIRGPTGTFSSLENWKRVLKCKQRPRWKPNPFKRMSL